MPKNNYLVSAIVSVYNCERFIAGCLEDLERQTIADRLEIVVVNTGSQQNEEAIIKRFQERYDNIVYIKTEQRETLYQAWNRGIKASSGKYITNANSDDRHRMDALEIMARELEYDDTIDLVYYDFIITETENETFDNCTPVGYLHLREFDRFQLIHSPSFGHQPMWRKELHKKFGYFDESFRIAGVREFWLRLCGKCKFKHINKYLGLYLENPKSLAHSDFELLTLERIRGRDKHIKKFVNNKKIISEIKKIQSADLFDLGYSYFQKKLTSQSRKTLLRSIFYNWCNFKSYKVLIASYLSVKMIGVFKKIKNQILF